MVTGGHNSSLIRSYLLPCKAVSLRASAQCPVPHPQQSSDEAANEPSTARYGVVVEPAIHDSPQPPANDPDVVMPSPPQDSIDAFQGAIDPLRHRLAPELESTPRRVVVQ